MNKVDLMCLHRAQFPENPIRTICQDYYEWKTYKNPVMAGDIYLEMRDGAYGRLGRGHAHKGSDPG